MPSTTASSLFPVKHIKFGFTTAQLDLNHVSKVPFSDPSLGVHKSSSQHPHKLVTPPQPHDVVDSTSLPQVAWEALYPKGSINPSGAIFGGFGFYLSGPSDFANRLQSATEALFSYRVMFEDNWEWVKGGKIPGICRCDSLGPEHEINVSVQLVE